jgi:hypothetical protein
MHQLGADTTPRVTGAAAAKAKKILREAGPESRAVLEHYVRQAVEPNSAEPSQASIGRLMLRFHQHGLSSELRRLGGLSGEQIVRCFPNAFVPYLRSLSEDSALDADDLLRVLQVLPETTLEAGAKQLQEQKEILDPELLRKLSRLGGRGALIFARALLPSRVPAVWDEIVAQLREFAGDHPEAVPLGRIDTHLLPLTYLEELCDFERTGRPNPRLRSQAIGLLCAFIDTTPNDANGAARKARAITGLAAFPGPASEALLKKELRGVGLLGPLRVPVPIRRAARAVRARWKELRRV